MRLASFYRKQKRWTEMENAVENGKAAADRDRHAGVALFNGASVLIAAHRDPALAARMLREYLASPTQTEEGRRLWRTCGWRGWRSRWATAPPQAASARLPWPWPAPTNLRRN